MAISEIVVKSTERKLKNCSNINVSSFRIQVDNLKEVSVLIRNAYNTQKGVVVSKKYDKLISDLSTIDLDKYVEQLNSLINSVSIGRYNKNIK